MLHDPPELGNEDPAFLALLEQARSNADRPRVILLVAADPPLADDADEVAEAKAVTAIKEWCEQHGETFGGVIR